MFFFRDELAVRPKITRPYFGRGDSDCSQKTEGQIGVLARMASNCDDKNKFSLQSFRKPFSTCQKKLEADFFVYGNPQQFENMSIVCISVIYESVLLSVFRIY